MPRLTIDLSESEHAALVELARANRRSRASEAAMLVARGLAEPPGPSVRRDLARDLAAVTP